MNSEYTIRRAESAADASKLNTLFSEVFHPEDVGAMAEIMFHHLPGLKREYWFIAEGAASGRIVSAFVLIPWTWQMEGARLKVAEMGIVGTLEAHRGRGLMRRLNKEFDQTLEKEGFDLAVIQGIPGFYQQFGYSYSLPLENHINLSLHLIPDRKEADEWAFRLAGDQDISYLMAQDREYQAAYTLSTFRDEAHWRYLLNESRQTEYGSEFWIMENRPGSEAFYFRIPQEGFGTGLIVSEVSEAISANALDVLFAFCKEMAVARDKPYIRFNLHNESPAGKMAIAMGARPGRPYAWQIKIPDAVRLLSTMAPVLQRRLQASPFQRFSGRLRLNFYKHGVDLNWREGWLESVTAADAQSDHTLSLPSDLFPALCLGYRSWQELRHVRPDINPSSSQSALLVEALFPPTRAWIHEQY
ncbi:MAG: GNAT family N-acetyltransferase [Candidatus Promineifilaceae bacterium]